MSLKKQLNAFDIFCIASGAMISSGIFILPGLAFTRTGPSLFISYFLAGMFAFLGSLSIIELSTAMPKAGGDYYYITRSLGPLIGTISGFLSWFALSLKSAFAVFGIAEVVNAFFGIEVIYISIVICLLFMALNIFGVKSAAMLEIILVVGLLAIIAVYVIGGITHINIPNFDPFAPKGTSKIFLTAGFVFVSYGGLLKISSIAEEAKDPKKTIPLGFISAIIIVTILYSLLLIVAIGTLDASVLTSSLTPIADSAQTFLGKPGFIIIMIAALLAFISTANAGIMAASRYPMALSRDNLLPAFVSKVNKRFHTPVISILLTTAFMIAALFLELEVLVKAASSVILTSYILTNLSVIILRESKIQNYQPSFKVPLYPWVQLISIVVFLFLIFDIGMTAIELSIGLIILSILIFFFYGRKKYLNEYALLHVIERIVNKKMTNYNLESELKEIIHERDEIKVDRFDHLVMDASVKDLKETMTMEELYRMLSREYSEEVGLTEEEFLNLLHEREKQSSTAINPFLAIPHIVVEGETNLFKMIMLRDKEGIAFTEEHDKVKAIFVLLGSRDERNFHLQALAAIAQIAMDEHFEKKWMQAVSENDIKDIFILGKRRRHNK